jgi:dihydrolipoamide dehydrogenase
MTRERICNAVVVGTGSTGDNVADRTVRRGLTAIVVESALVGTGCSHVGGVPGERVRRRDRHLHAG